MKLIFGIILLTLLLIPINANAQTIKLISNTDRCKYIAPMNKDYCEAVYEITGLSLDEKKISFQYKDSYNKVFASFNNKLNTIENYNIKSGSITVKITGYKNPYADVDHVFCYDGICEYKWAWWNSSFLFKIPINVSTLNGTVNIMTLLNDSSVNINGSKEIVWCNVTANTTRSIGGYFYFTNYSFYQCVDPTETFAIAMNIDEGNGTDFGNTESSLIGWYHQNEKTGGIADQSDAGHDCTRTGDPTSLPGVIGRGMSYDGSGDFFNCGKPADFDFGSSQDFTILLWNNFTNSPSISGGMVAKRNPGNNDGWYFHIRNTDGRIEMGFRPSSGSNVDVLSVGFDARNNQFYHYGITANRTGDAILYVNGEENNSASITAVGDIDQNVDLLIGRNPSANDFNGFMDEIMIFDRVLTPDEIKAIYDNQVGNKNYAPLGDVIRNPDTNITLNHFDAEVDYFLVISSDYQTIINNTITIIDAENLVIKGSGTIFKQSGGGATSVVSAKLIFNGATLFDESIRSVRGTSDIGVFTIPISNVISLAGANTFILQMKRTGNDPINVSNLAIHTDTNVTNDNTFIVSGVTKLNVNYTSTSFTNIANFTIDKETNSTIVIDLDHTFQSTSNNIVGICYLESFETGEKTDITYSRWLESNGNIGSTGINYRSQIPNQGIETWMLFCRSSTNNLMLNNITSYLLNQKDKDETTINGFQNSSFVSGLTGSDNIILSTNYSTKQSDHIEILTTIIMQSSSGSQDGTDSPVFTIKNDIGCSNSTPRSLTSNNDIGTAKIYMNCDGVPIGQIVNYQVLVDVSGGETLDILNITMSTYETNPLLVIQGIVTPIIQITNPEDNETIDGVITIESTVIDLSRTGWRSEVFLLNTTGSIIEIILNETSFQNTTSRSFDTSSTPNENYSISWTIFNTVGNTTDNVFIIILNIPLPTLPDVVQCFNDDILFIRVTEDKTVNGSQTIEVIETLFNCQYGCSNVTLLNWGFASCRESDLQLSFILIGVVLIVVIAIRKVV